MRPIKPWQVLAWMVVAILLVGPDVSQYVPKLPSIFHIPFVQRATDVVYVYEKDETAIPNGVESAINQLNRDKKLTATIFEQDTKDGSGDTPEQYKAALAAAKKAGLPALVVLANGSVLKVVKDPKDAQAVLEAVP